MFAQEIARLVDLCVDIGNQSVDADGFVPIRALLSRFQARLVARPLLVEAMLATLGSAEGSANGDNWAVFVDSESSGLLDVQQALSSERRSRALPPRLRNTIAHELAHSLAFRPSDFGVKLTISRTQDRSKDQFVREVEAITEKLSPLLLLPTTALDRWLASEEETVSAATLGAFCRDMGVSRHVLVSRLSMLMRSDPLAHLGSKGLSGIGVGLCERGVDGHRLFRKWPLFSNFTRGLAPAFFWTLLQGQDRASARDLLPEGLEEAFATPSSTARFRVAAGSRDFPRARQMDISIDFEPRQSNSRSPFFFVVRGDLVSQKLGSLEPPACRETSGGPDFQALRRVAAGLGKKTRRGD